VAREVKRMMCLICLVWLEVGEGRSYEEEEELLFYRWISIIEVARRHNVQIPKRRPNECAHY